MGKRKPVYPYKADWELEVPELTEEQEAAVHQILNNLGKQRKTIGKITETTLEDYRVIFPSRGEQDG